MSVQVLHFLNHTPKLHFLFESTTNSAFFCAALGHKYGSEITAVYINPDIRKVDALNRRMLDLVFKEP